MVTLRLLAAMAWLAVLAAAPRAQRKSKLKVGTLAHFEEFCRRFIVLDNGKPFELEAFQRIILKGYFAGVTETLVLLPKKNGKTTLLAALALYHLIYTRDAECYIAASAIKQAGIMYKQLCGFVERKGPDGALLPQAKALQKRVLLRKATKEVRSRRDNGLVQVLSGDVDTGDGVIPTLALVDELHRHKDDGALYGVLLDGLTDDRHGQLITISTAGQSMKQALGRIRRKAYKMGAKRDGAYVHVLSPNGEFEMHEWSLPDDADLQDIALVKRANPLVAMSVERLRQRKDSPSTTPSQWARFACGVWMRGEDSAISSVDWTRSGHVGLVLDVKRSISLGVDLAWYWDCTAIVPGQGDDREEFEEEGARLWRWRRVRLGVPTILHPPRDGNALPFEKVIAAILAFGEEYTIEQVVLDPKADGIHVAEELETKHGLVVVEHSQDPGPMADASMGFAEAVGHGRVEHPANDAFTDQVLAGIAKSAGGGEKWRFAAPTQRRGQRKKGVQENDGVEYVDAGTAAVILHHNLTAPRPVEIEIDPASYRAEFV